MTMNESATTVHRRLGTSILKETGSIQQAVDILAALPGMISAKADTSGKRIQVCYDVTNLQFPNLIQALEAKDIVKEPGWWDRFRFSSYRFQDINIRDNAQAKPGPCCSNPKKIVEQSRKKSCH
jgi:hypothetical protein